MFQRLNSGDGGREVWMIAEAKAAPVVERV